jgi:L-lactate utilization protein LutB
VNLQQIKRDLEEIKDAINPKTLRPDLSKVKEELKAKLYQIYERMQERGELPELTVQETEEIKETVLKALRERTAELKKDPYFQRYIRGI